VPTGLGIGIAQHLRFAASEAVGPKQQTRALALVMSGGIVAAVAGPELVTLTKDLFVPALFFGTYLCLAVLPIVTALLLAALEQPPVATRAVPTIPIRGVLQRRDFLVAAATSMVAFAGMNLIGTSLPIQMTLCGFGISDSATVLGLHGIAMFAPGFITGRLIEAFGPHRVIVTGAVLNLSCAALAFAGSAYLSFAIALILLGLGWNMMFTGATALLARSHGPENRVRVQAANDFLMFGGVAFATFGSEVLESAFGWGAVNMAFVPMMVLGLGLVLWHRACGPPRRLATSA
jgi:predicted MFS family arabinose efflux permease